MNKDPDPNLTQPNKNSIRLLRIILWLLPAFAIPICIIPFLYFSPASGWPEMIWIAPLILCLGLVFGIGLTDQWIRNHQNQSPLWYREPGKLHWALTFVIFQIVLAPVILATTMFAVGTMQRNLR